MSVSKMSKEFHDWLAECPVQWFRGKEEDGYVEYEFKIDTD